MQASQVESFAEKMYNSASPEERMMAANALSGFSNQVEYVPQCKFILTNSNNQYGLMLASTSLLKLVTSFWNSFSREQVLELRDFLLAFLGNRTGTVPDFIIANVIHVLSRITKLGWLKYEELKAVSQSVISSAHSGPSEYVLALQFLGDLVDSINLPVKGQSAMVQRKIAVSFRESNLFDIFQMSIETLKKLASKQMEVSNPDLLVKLRKNASDLALKCLKFDYIGTNADESSEDFGSLQIPSSWRSIIEDVSLLEMLFSMTYRASTTEAPIVMEILVQLASCRRSLFSDSTTRHAHLGMICKSSARIASDQGNYLVNEATHTQFCRLLLALKANYQLQELVKLETYGEWISAVTQFSILCFRNWDQTGYSVHYLVTLWARLVMSIAYVGSEFETFLNEYIPQITTAYLDTRLKSVERVVIEESIPEMFDELALDTQLQYIHIICKHSYPSTLSYLHGMMSQLLTQYREMLLFLQSPKASTLNLDSVMQIQVVEYKISWLVYTIGCIISGGSSSGGSPQSEQLDCDARLIALVIEVVSLSNMRKSSFTQFKGPEPPEALQLSILRFFQHIRKAHIGYDTYARSMRVLDPNSDPEIYNKISEIVGSSITQTDMLTHIIQEVVGALEFWANDEKIIEEALTLLSDMATGHTSSKLMVNLDCCKQLMTQHGAKYFKFMSNPKNFRYRTKFYLTWGRLALSSKNMIYFEEFMRPFDEQFQILMNAAQSPVTIKSMETQLLLASICRDIRGVIASIYLGSVYEEFFDWIHPQYFQVIKAVFEQNMDNPIVSVAVLRFLSEYALNQANRIDFGASSPNGIFLFKEVVGVVEVYAEHMTSLVQSQRDSVAQEDRYKAYIKPLSLCMQVFKNCLSGGYMNFGVFTVYNDDCLRRVFFRMTMYLGSVGLNEVKDFQKAIKNYFDLIECMFRDHLDLLSQMDPRSFYSFLSSLQEGIFNEDSNVATQSACAIDHFISFLKSKSKKRKSSETFERLKAFVAQSGEILTTMLASLLNLVIFESVPNMWAFSRPILALILLNENGFNHYRSSLIGFQPMEKQELVAAEFTKLMDNITESLDSKNRDLFTQQLIFFAVGMKKIVIKPPAFA